MSQIEERENASPAKNDSTKWNYNGSTFQIDVGDADDAEHIEQVFTRFQQAENTLKKDGSIADIVRAYDKLFRDFYDDLFGEGAGDAILGERKNIDNCNDSYWSFLQFIDNQNEHFMQRMERLNTMEAKYSSNRAQRRGQTYRRG